MSITEKNPLFKFLKIQYNFREVKWLETAGGLSGFNDFVEANEQIFVLKKFRSKEESIVRKIEDTTFFLHNHGLPISVPIKNIDGQYSIRFQENLYALYPKVKGIVLHEPSFTPPLLRSSAELLFRFHQLKANCSIELPQVPSNIHSLQKIKEKGEKMVKKIAETSLDSKIINLLNELINAKISLLEILDFQSIDHFLSVKDLVHGDFHNENLLFNKLGQVVLLLDFEEVHFGNRLEDIFHFIQLACCNSGYKQKNLKIARFFFDAYNEKYPIQESEFRLGLHYALYKESSSFFLENELSESEDPSLVTYLERDRKKIEFFKNNIEHFIRAFY